MPSDWSGLGNVGRLAVNQIAAVASELRRIAMSMDKYIAFATASNGRKKAAEAVRHLAKKGFERGDKPAASSASSSNPAKVHVAVW